MSAPYKNWSWNASEWGALGDGVADDTDALQRALDAMPHSNNAPTFNTAEGGELFFPEGKYRTTKPLIVRSGCVLRGQGQGSIINLRR